MLKQILYSLITVLLCTQISFADKKINVVCTIGMITDVTKEVGGDRIDVRGIMKSGIDPHLYKATRSDIVLLSNADVIFYNGLFLEGKMTDALIRVASAGKKVFAVTELLDEKYLLEPKEFQGHFDPHVWMDPKAWARAVELIRDKLAEADPKGKDVFYKNAKNYLLKLEKLDKYATDVLNSVPKDSRVLVTAHDAFNYFGKRFGYEVLGIQGLSTDSEAGVKDIERIVSLLVGKKISAVFIESTVSDKNIKALIEGAAARNHQVKIGGELFSDAMGKNGTYEGTYIGMIDHNVTTISRALGGNAPEKGMEGHL